MDLTSYYMVTDAGIFFSFLGFFLVCIPLWWHLEAWNMGCVLYIFWSGSQVLIQGINMSIWRDNVIDWAPIWCDIASHWKIMSTVGICAASLCINRRLYKIATISTVQVTRGDKKRMIILDCSIGLGLPILAVVLYYWCQGQRYDLVQGVGCMYDIPNTWIAIVLFNGWPVVIGLVSAVYCSLTIFHFIRRRRQFNELMSSSTMINYNRYFRLMGLALIEILGTVPIGMWTVSQYWRYPQYKFIGYADLHSGFGRIPQVPAILWLDTPLQEGYLMMIWVSIICPFIFFGFFGLAEEARRHYHSAATSIAKRLGISTTLLGRNGQSGFTKQGGSSGFGKITIPSFVQRHPATTGGLRTTRRDSLESFSDRLSTSVSIQDAETMGDAKNAYAMSVHSGGSSTFGSSPVTPADEKTAARFEIRVVEEVEREDAEAIDLREAIRASMDVARSHAEKTDDIV